MNTARELFDLLLQKHRGNIQAAREEMFTMLKEQAKARDEEEQDDQEALVRMAVLLAEGLIDWVMAMASSIEFSLRVSAICQTQSLRDTARRAALEGHLKSHAAKVAKTSYRLAGHVGSTLKSFKEELDGEEDEAGDVRSDGDNRGGVD